MNLARLVLDGVDPGMESRVRSCAERFRDRVRDSVKDAFMFTLGGRGVARHSVGLSCKRGDAVLEAISFHGDALGTALSAYRESIAGGLSCLERLEAARSSLQGEAGAALDAMYPGDDSSAVRNFLVALDARTQRAGVVECLLSLRNDYLGAYEPAERSGHIVLHWGLIGLVAPRFGVSVEAMTLMVLAHEYAHALSHLGLDANGDHWELGSYLRADRHVHEGLANYFSEVALAASADWWFQEALVALRSLVQKQEPPYREFLHWQKDLKAKPEAVRAALRMARTMPRVDAEEFRRLLLDYSRGR